MTIEEIIEDVSNWVWSTPLVVLCLAAGLYFSFGTRFVQIRRFGEMARLLFSTDNSQKTGITSFQAFAMALSGRVGTGNIVGVATAIGYGGPGSIVWMWIIAFLGAGTAFSEATLAQVFKEQHKGEYRGGPAYYIEKGLKKKWLGVIFAVCAVIGCGFFLPPLQSNGFVDSFSNTLNVDTTWIGLVVALLIGVVIIGGVKRIANVAQVVAPFMAIIYILLSIIILIIHASEVPAVFGDMISSAFGMKAAFGGILGNTIAWGVKRGLYSNEAGQGTGPIVAAAAKVSHPVKQGMVQAFSVYVDTLLVCSATAVMILACNTYNVYDRNQIVKTETVCEINDPDHVIVSNDQNAANVLDEQNNVNETTKVKYLMIYESPVAQLDEPDVSYTMAAISTLLGKRMGGLVVSFALFFFAFTTIMAYYYYAETNLVYLFGKGRKERLFIWILRIGLVAAVFYGGISEANKVWDLGDIGVGVMAWINIIAILLLSRIPFKLLRSYEKQEKKGEDPVFDPDELNIKNADFWQKKS